MKKKQLLLPTKKFFKAPEEDITIPLELEDNSKLLREGDRDIVLNISELFDYERNQSINYKIYGKIKMIFRNMYSGSTTYDPLLRQLYVPNEDSLNVGFMPYNEFALIRNDTLHEVNQPTTGNTLNVILKGKEYTGHTITTNSDAPYKNWNLYLSYVFDQDYNFPMKYTLTGLTSPLSFNSGDGIPFRVEKNGNKYTLTSPIEHGMIVGEYITVSGQSINGNVSGRTFSILSVGNEVHNSEKYVLEIMSNVNINDTLIVGKRCLDINNITETTSKYYVHKHKIMTDVGDYIIDNAGFEKPIWEEERKILFENALGENDVFVVRNRMESLIYDFKEPIVLSGITNNLGYTPTEVYVTTIFRNGNGYFNYPPQVGYKFNFHNTWIDNHFNGTITEGIMVSDTNESVLQWTNFTSNGKTFHSGNTLEPEEDEDFLYGAFVEYNETELKERIISESFHKITIRPDIFNHGQTGTTSNFTGASVNNPFGLYYQNHYRVKLRQLSPYIETSNTDQIYNLPENTRYNELEKIWKWRDLYDHGYIDPDGYGTNFPFANNTHYVKNDINFFLRNEEVYTNKTDGITSFNNRTLKTNC